MHCRASTVEDLRSRKHIQPTVCILRLCHCRPLLLREASLIESAMPYGSQDYQQLSLVFVSHVRFNAGVAAGLAIVGISHWVTTTELSKLDKKMHELKTEFEEYKKDVKTESRELRKDVKTELKELRQDVAELYKHMKESMKPRRGFAEHLMQQAVCVLCEAGAGGVRRLPAPAVRGGPSLLISSQPSRHQGAVQAWDRIKHLPPLTLEGKAGWGKSREGGGGGRTGGLLEPSRLAAGGMGKEGGWGPGQSEGEKHAGTGRNVEGVEGKKGGLEAGASKVFSTGELRMYKTIVDTPLGCGV
ncbi:hypothetical protein V8C86DRAFT_2433423 [Haematococcus lacustris]